MNLESLTVKLNENPESIEFNEVIELIESLYDFVPTRFNNGELENEEGTNNGSCKIFGFAKLHGLSEEHTLACFGHYYRDDVLMHPEADDHGNIRNFMKTGWSGISFSGEALLLKA